MTRPRHSSRSALFHGSIASALLLAAGCGDDAAPPGTSGSGCITDIECKGERLCREGVCVDPEGAGDPDGGTSSGSSGSGSGTGSPDSDGGSGSGGSSSGAAGSRPPVIDDPELERACSLDCEARKAADCPMDIGSLDQCLGQCLIIDEVNRGYCLEEQRAQYACRASGGYTCFQGYPQPAATCLNELSAVSMCGQMAPCRELCDRTAGQCSPEGEACVTDCMDMMGSFEDAICGIYYTQLVSCWGRAAEPCDGEELAIEPCTAQVAEVADCIGSRSNHECEGFCWAAEQLGCGGTDCVTTCMALADAASCGSYYDRVIDCAVGSRELNIACVDGVPTPDATACASELMQHTMCTDMM